MIEQQTPLVSQRKNKTYYYPSQKSKSILGTTSFIPRFPKQLEAESRCSKFCKWLIYYFTHKRLSNPTNMEEVQVLLPMTKPIFTQSQDLITYTWLGHSTALISIGNHANILIDPVFSLRCSPIQWMGPRRYRPPACQIQKLPQIHAVFISHDHYDHLDQQALLQLQQKFKPTFVAGLNSRDCFPKGCKLIQMDWTQSIKIQINQTSFQIIFFPVCHWAKRKVYENNNRLWGGFVIKTPKGQKILYSGDTAYCEIFKQIGSLFGPFQLSILPIGAYLPRHLLSQFHVDPEEAVIIHQQIKSKKSIGVHWGTFPLGFQHYYQPKLDLEKAKLKHGIKQDQFITIGHGSQFSIPYK